MAATVYLTGPVTGLSYGAADGWREGVAEMLRDHGLHGVSPMRAERYLAAETTLEQAYPAHAASTPRAICTRSRYDAQKADALLVNLLGAKKVSIGTMFEVAWADAARVPIVVVMEPGDLENIHDHPMVREVAYAVVDTVDEAVEILVRLLAPYR